MKSHAELCAEVIAAELARAVREVNFMHTYPGAGRDPDYLDRERADATARRLGMRPLRPPPGAIPDRYVPAARLALLKDRRKGIIGTPVRRAVTFGGPRVPFAKFY